MLARRGPGLVRGVARTAAIAGTATAVSGRVGRRQQARFAAQAPADPAPAAPGGDDYTGQLTELAQLHDQGVLTDDEFAAKKAQILGI
jgi:hypothetical protein